MARELKITKAFKSVFTGKGCVIKKILDITEECSKANKKKRAILIFTRLKSGRRIVQITQPYEGQEYMGTSINFCVDELEREIRMVRPDHPDNTFGLTAMELGLSKPALRSLIEKHAPAA